MSAGGFATCGRGRQLPGLFADRRDLVANLDVSDVAPRSIRGIERASLAPFGAVQVTNTERDGERIRLTYSPWEADEPERCDARLLARDMATLTALEPVCEGSAVLADLAGPLRP